MKKYNEYVNEERKSLKKTRKLIGAIGLFIAATILFQVIRFFALGEKSYFLMTATALSIVYLIIAFKNQKANLRPAQMDKKEIEDIEKKKEK